MKIRPWTKFDVKALRGVAKKGYSSTFAANWLGRTVAACKFKAMKLGIRFHSIEQPVGIQSKVQKRRHKRNAK